MDWQGGKVFPGAGWLAGAGEVPRAGPLEIPVEVPVEVALEVPLEVHCVLAPNASPMTLDGTNTWVINEADASFVIDPGPLAGGHDAAILAAVGERHVKSVLVTHHHADHAEGAGTLAERLRCPVRALDPGLVLGSQGCGAGEVLRLGELEVHVVATPGHTSDSLSFWVPHAGAVLTGDTVLGRGTSMIAHPDGDLGAYLGSLDNLLALCTEHDINWVWPGHGPVLPDALGVLEFYQAHRRERLAQVADAVAQLRADSAPDSEGLADQDLAEQDLAEQVVRLVYADVSPVLWPAAALSVRAQLAYLAETMQMHRFEPKSGDFRFTTMHEEPPTG